MYVCMYVYKYINVYFNHPEFKILNKIDFIKMDLLTTSSRKNESDPHLSIKKVSNKKLLYHLFHFA